MTHTVEGLKAGPLAGQDLSLLNGSRSVLTYHGDQKRFLAIFQRLGDGAWPVRIKVIDGPPGRTTADKLTYIGERDADGWIHAPAGGWAENPAPGMRLDGIDVETSGRSDLTKNPHHSDHFDWPRIIAFRPAAQTVEGAGERRPMEELGNGHWVDVEPTAPSQSGGEAKDKEWPDTPLSNALLDHFTSEYGLSVEEGCEAAGDVLDIIEKHSAQSGAQASEVREKVARIIRDQAQIGGTDWHRLAAFGGDINADDLADAILAALPPSDGENGRLREALKFYADPNNHEPPQEDSSTVCERDGGFIARAALSGGAE